MFEHDRSAARGKMASHRVIAFKHSSTLGHVSAHELFDRVTVQRRCRGDLYALDEERLDNAPPDTDEPRVMLVAPFAGAWIETIQGLAITSSVLVVRPGFFFETLARRL
jgi:hypothetical protein